MASPCNPKVQPLARRDHLARSPRGVVVHVVSRRAFEPFEGRCGNRQFCALQVSCGGDMSLLLLAWETCLHVALDGRGPRCAPAHQRTTTNDALSFASLAPI